LFPVNVISLLVGHLLGILVKHQLHLILVLLLLGRSQ